MPHYHRWHSNHWAFAGWHGYETRVAGLDARTYILQSITNPSAYLNPGFKDVMPKSFGTFFSEAELSDLVDYLMTLKQAFKSVRWVNTSNKSAK